VEFWISALVLTTSQDSVTELRCMYVMFSLNSVCFMVQHNAGYFLCTVLCCFHCGSWAVNQFCWFNEYKTRWAWQCEKVFHFIVINLYLISSFYVFLHPEWASIYFILMLLIVHLMFPVEAFDASSKWDTVQCFFA